MHSSSNSSQRFCLQIILFFIAHRLFSLNLSTPFYEPNYTFTFWNLLKNHFVIIHCVKIIAFVLKLLCDNTRTRMTAMRSKKLNNHIPFSLLHSFQNFCFFQATKICPSYPPSQRGRTSNRIYTSSHYLTQTKFQ